MNEQKFFNETQKIVQQLNDSIAAKDQTIHELNERIAALCSPTEKEAAEQPEEIDYYADLRESHKLHSDRHIQQMHEGIEWYIKFFAKEPITDEPLQKDVWDEAAKTKSLTYEDATPHQGLGPAIFLEGYTYAASPLQALLKEKVQEIREAKSLILAFEEQLTTALTEGYALQKQLTELKEENERLKRETAQNWDSLADIKKKYVESYLPEWQNGAAYHFDEITKLFADKMEHYKYYQPFVALAKQELTDLRALHTQQMGEAWDASEAYLYFTEGPGPYAPDKSTYISKITGQ